MQTGLISNIQKFSLHDGPGIRTTVFLKGCPLRCAWCHNPENLAPRPEVMLFPKRCVRCGQCREVCPQWAELGGDPALHIDGKSFSRDGDERQKAGKCLVCGACVEACPTGARVLVGKRMAVDEVLAEVMKDRIFYEDSDGGVTFSGGEPLTQSDFLKAALIACRSAGLHTAVDTCGFAPAEQLEAIGALVDLFLFDLKFMDSARHIEFCGVSNERIVENLRNLAQRHGNIWVRVPIIPGVNDSAAELDAMSAFVATLPGVRQVNLLPYHRNGVHKFEQLGREYSLAGLLAPSSEEMGAARSRFAMAGVAAKVGG